MIKVKQLAHACIFVRDLEASQAFYRDVLGMQIRFNFLRNGKIFGYYLDCGDRSHVEVFLKDKDPPIADSRINHFCLEVEDIDAAILHIRSKGVDVSDKKLGCDGTWQAWVRDPDQVRIELFEYTRESAQFTGGDREADW